MGQRTTIISRCFVVLVLWLAVSGTTVHANAQLPEEVCTLFPEPAQGWISASGTPSVLDLTNGNSAELNGWSATYLAENHIQKETDGQLRQLLMTGFDRHTDNWQAYAYQVCGPYGCETGNADGKVNQRKIVEPEPVKAHFDSLLSLSVDNGNDLTSSQHYTNACAPTNLQAGKRICSYRENGSELILSIHENLKSLNVFERTSTGKITLLLDDGVNIEEYTSENEVNFYMRSGHTLTIGRYTTNTGKPEMTFENNVRLNIVDRFEFSNATTFIYLNGARNVVFYGPHATFNFNETNSDFYGYILGQSVVFNNPINIYGSVSSQKLTLKRDVKIHKPDYDCATMTKPGELKVEPKKPYALTCEVAEVEFSLVDDTGAPIETENSAFTAQAIGTGSAKWCKDAAGTECIQGESYSSQFIKGKKTLYLGSQTLSNYRVHAFKDDKTAMAPLDIEFLPFKFDTANLSVTAGEHYPSGVTTQVMACADEKAVATDYQGKPTAHLTLYPTLSGNSEQSLMSFSPEFTAEENGVSTDDFALDEAGIFYIDLEDSHYDCTGKVGCPIDGQAKLKGRFWVFSHPWKLKICDVTSVNGLKTNPQGTTADTGQFIASGEEFIANVIPIVHPDYHSDRNTPANECAYQTTYNYFSESWHIAPNNITFSVAYPNQGKLDNLADFPSDQRFQKADLVNGRRVKQIRTHWSEVGSIAMKTEGSYYGNLIEGDTQTIGRFYPAKFQGIPSLEIWDYYGAQSFNYMEQNFDYVRFGVEPLNTQGQGVENYRLFDEKLTASFNLTEVSSGNRYTSRFVSPEFGEGRWHHDEVGERNLGFFDWTNESTNRCRDSKSLCWIKDIGGSEYPDGPFNLKGQTISDNLSTVTNISITAAENNVDPVIFVANSQRLTKQPDIRFGRTTLDDVGGYQGQVLTVPLEVEYWQNQAWQRNTDDHQSLFNGTHHCVAPIVSSQSNNNVAVSGSGNVLAGRSRTLKAQQVQEAREQVRVWLAMSDDDIHCVTSGSSSHPWLRYNWDTSDIDEEDPSAVITFGIYRGNDRVIFRGESGLIGQ